MTTPQPLGEPGPDTPTPSSPGGAAAPGRARLAGVDGLRALAALWVLLFHMRAFSGAKLWPGLDRFVRSGSTGVSLFLVLSGFCLFVPVAGGRLSRFRTPSFLRRRCGRLLPTYFASLVAVLVLYILADGRLGLRRLTHYDLLVQTATHATLTHQLFPSTFYGLNGAYWSLGLEWELYLTLPLLVLTVRRFGLPRTLAAVLVANVGYRLGLYFLVDAGLLGRHTVLSAVVLPNLFLGRWIEFGLGMWAADVYRRGQVHYWSRRSILLALPALVLAFGFPEDPLEHVLFGLVFFALLMTVLDGSNPVARIVSWRPLVAIGTMSYSLYLVHQPIVEVVARTATGHGMGPQQAFMLLLALVPAMLCIAWLLFITVERRSISTAKVGAPPARRGAAEPGTLSALPESLPLAPLRGDTIALPSPQES
jgi:peptidoglycan/LPS O-acetylase OafA/YrhL